MLDWGSSLACMELIGVVYVEDWFGCGWGMEDRQVARSANEGLGLDEWDQWE